MFDPIEYNRLETFEERKAYCLTTLTVANKPKPSTPWWDSGYEDWDYEKLNSYTNAEQGD